MFHKAKCGKTSHAVPRRTLSKLRERVVAAYGASAAVLLDTWCNDAKAVGAMAPQMQCWHSSTGAEATVYLFLGVPLFFTCALDKPPSGCRSTAAVQDDDTRLLPTLFFLLAYAQHQRSEASETHAATSSPPTQAGEEGSAAVPHVLVRCHPVTARALLGGASLMMPGVVDTHVCTQLVPHEACNNNDTGAAAEHESAAARRAVTENMAALIAIATTSTTCSVPFAVGLATQALASCACNGVGVTVLHCVGDKLWQAHVAAWPGSLPHNVFAVYACTAPQTMASNDDNKTKDDPEDDKDDEDKDADGGDAKGTTSDAPAASKAVAVEDMFASDEEVLQYCLCEAVLRCVSMAMPITLDQFMGLFWAARPQTSARAKSLHGFKKTQYKSAQAYVASQHSLVSLRVKQSRPCMVTSVARKHALLDEHRRKYAPPPPPSCAASHGKKAVRQDGVNGEDDMASAAAYMSKYPVTLLVVRRIYTLMRPGDRMTEDLARLLLCGDTDVSPTHPVDHSRCPIVNVHDPELAMEGDEEELTERVIRNLNAYIDKYELCYHYVYDAPWHRVKSYGYTWSTRKWVQMDGVLSHVSAVDCRDDETLVQRIMNVFRRNTIVELCHPVTKVHKTVSVRRLMPVHVSVRKSGGHFVTRVINLEQYGYNLDEVCRCLATELNVGGTVDCALDAPARLKNGQENPRIIIMQGKCERRVVTFLVNVLRIPSEYIE